jgi:hypothetical protein
VAVLDGHAALHLGQDLTETQGPIRAGEARLGIVDDAAERDEGVGEKDDAEAEAVRHDEGGELG